MKKLKYLSILILVLVMSTSCSDDSDDQEPVSIPFLEKINGIVWEDDENNMENADKTRNYRFNDTSKVIVEGWTRNDYEDSDCFEYSFEGPFTILESSSNKLVLADPHEEGGVLYENFVTLTLEENGLKIVRFDDFTDDFGTMIWVKSSIDVNALKICN